MREGTDDVTEIHPTQEIGGTEARMVELGQQLLRSPGALTLPTLDDLQSLLPNAAIEEVGQRRELVIYTGWSTHTDGETLVPMIEGVD